VSALLREGLRIEREVDGCAPGVTATVTRIRGGEVKNTVPAVAELTVDLRAPTAEALRDAAGRLGAFGVHDGVVLSYGDEPGFPPLLRAPALVEQTLHALRAAGAPATEATAGGVSDGSWCSSVGVPTVDGLGPIGDDDHTPAEWIDLRSVGPRIDAVSALCRTLGASATAPAGDA
jgi:glutamate carboxypeptidase